jgi:3-polyprenyl-4-hydroxybenzoate decarboxylase
MGVTILPPVPAFYNHPQNLDDMVSHVAMRTLDQFDLHLDVVNRWDGRMASGGAAVGGLARAADEAEDGG